METRLKRRNISSSIFTKNSWDLINLRIKISKYPKSFQQLLSTVQSDMGFDKSSPHYAVSYSGEREMLQNSSSFNIAFGPIGTSHVSQPLLSFKSLPPSTNAQNKLLFRKKKMTKNSEETCTICSSFEHLSFCNTRSVFTCKKNANN